MILQKILLPRIETCTINDLYFRCSNKNAYDITEQRLTLNEGDAVTFDTLFGSFSIGKWKKYTCIDDLSVELDACGDFTVTLMHAEKINNTVRTKMLQARSFHLRERENISLSFPMDCSAGLYYFAVQAKKKETFIYGGNYYTTLAEAKQNDVRIGIAICTYKREKYLKKNLDSLNREVIDDPGAPTCGNMDVFVSDNGCTLDASELSNEHVHIFKNMNVGGTGGFTRSLIEILHYGPTKFTHVLFTDDDIVFEPDIFSRTYAFLCCLKSKYRHCSVGGATMRLEDMKIQHTRGDCWNGGFGKQTHVKDKYDLTRLNDLLSNEIEERVQYSPWTFCCVPLSVVRRIGLPLPIFIHRDDVEYGLRSGAPVIFIHGVGVWHSFGASYPGAYHYYDMRNALIANAIHYTGSEIGEKRLIRYIRNRAVQSVLRFRYGEVEQMLRGVEDFCRGVDWLKEQDPIELHKEVSGLGYRPVKVDELPQQINYPQFLASFKFNESKWRKIRRKITLNGWLTKSRRIVTVSLLSCRPINFYKVKQAIQYNQTNDTGIVTEKSYIELFRTIDHYFRVRRLIYKRLGEVSAEYRSRYTELITEDYWRGYLHLEPLPAGSAALVAPKGKLSVAPPPPKAQWLKKHFPRIWSRTYKIFNPPPFSFRASWDTHLKIAACRVLSWLHLSGLDPRMTAIRQARGRHAGERCFVIGLGPSLRVEDLERLKNEYTFASNSVFLLFDKTDWRPTYYTCIDAKGHERFINSMKQGVVSEGEIPQREAYLSSRLKLSKLTGKERFLHIHFGNHTRNRMLTKHMKRCGDISIALYDLFTVTNAAIEIAMYMGFTEIYLLGVDCDYSGSNGKIHVVETDIDEMQRHTPGRQRLQDHSTRLMQNGYEYMAKVAGENGVKIFNATRGGALEVFPRVDFDSIDLK